MQEASPLPEGFRSTPEQRMFVEFLRIERNLEENQEFIPEFLEDYYMQEASPLPEGFRSTPEQRMFVEFLRIERNLEENQEFIPEFLEDYKKWHDKNLAD